MAMRSCRLLRPWLSLIAVMLLHPAAPAAGADDEKVPEDFRVVAHYYAGYSVLMSWETTITADGKAVQEKPEDEREPKKTSRLSPREIRSLVNRIETSRFFDLKPRYEISVTDAPSLMLQITMGGKQHKVERACPFAPGGRPRSTAVLRGLGGGLEKGPVTEPRGHAEALPTPESGRKKGINAMSRWQPGSAPPTTAGR